MPERWARFDTETNALDSLEKSIVFLRTVKNNHEDWKWVVICAFSSIYGFAIQVAKGSSDLSVVRETKSKHHRLISFGEALKICKQPLGARDALVMTKEEDASIKTIQNEFRNNFEHFNPGSWSIEISGFPKHIFNVICVIEKLALDLNFYCHLNIDQINNLRYLIEEGKFISNKLREMYA